MKRILKTIVSISCAVLSVFGLTACNTTSSGVDVIGKPDNVTDMDNNERNENKFADIHESAENFASNFAAIAYKQYDSEENFAVSPLSVYMALSIAAQCSAGETQSEILSTLGMTYDNLNAEFSDYYRSVFAEYTARLENNEIVQTGVINLTNSVWLDSHTNPKQECIDTLADKFFCYSYRADFVDDNENANKAVREFVKENTKGLIDKDFALSAETVFALINTLYLKDCWNTTGRDLPFTDKNYDFLQNDGSIKSIKLLHGYSNYGQVVEGDDYSTFFTKTNNGNKIDFILPKEGYGIDDVFTAENIEKVKSLTSYNGVNHEKKQRYYTSCLFPEFTATYDEQIGSILAKMGITTLFDSKKCDFTGLTDDYAVCGNITHTTKLTVDRKGIEGAAVTIMPSPGAAGPDEYEDVYLNFVVDKAFGFIISDRYGNTLFSGVVKNI